MPTKKCPYCAEEIQEEAVKCRYCGSWIGAAPPPPVSPGDPYPTSPGMTQQRRLMRSSADRMLVGVCGGIGKYVGIDPTLVRIAYVLLTIFTGIIPGLLAYILLGIVIPLDPTG